MFNFYLQREIHTWYIRTRVILLLYVQHVIEKVANYYYYLLLLLLLFVAYIIVYFIILYFRSRYFRVLQTLLQGSSAPLPEYKTSALKKSRWVLSHYGVFKTCWDWLILIATFYVAIVVPYNASFVNTDKPSMVSDVVVESLFIVGKSIRQFTNDHWLEI